MNFANGWQNLDGSIGVLVAKVPGLFKLLKFCLGRQSFLSSQWNPKILFHDFRNPLPYETGTVDVIYTSHLLEHLYKSEQDYFIAECKRVLKSNGVIRIVVPDLNYIVKEYVHCLQKGKAAETLNRMMCSHPDAPYQGNFIYRIMKRINSFQEHRWMHDAESLTSLLEHHQFRRITVSSPLNSEIDQIEEIEKQRGSDSLFVEALS